MELIETVRKDKRDGYISQCDYNLHGFIRATCLRQSVLLGANAG
jgi:hypothetical protein